METESDVALESSRTHDRVILAPIVSHPSSAPAFPYPYKPPTTLSNLEDLNGKGKTQASEADNANATKLSSKENTPSIAEALLETSPALKNALGAIDKDNATLRKIDITNLSTGLTLEGKNLKDIDSFKFWQTQPVPRFDGSGGVSDGPIKIIDPEKVSKKPDPLIEGFEWATLDLTNETELQELWDLLTYHYVEDDDAMFRFRYSQSFLHWYVGWS